MKKCVRIMAALSVVAMAVFVVSCGRGTPSVTAVPDVLSLNKGKVIVALLGMPGCPGTEQATPFMAEYSQARPAGVLICRVDVPTAGQTFERAGNVSSNLTYILDQDRAVAKKLEFFFYPTLYILDRDGVVRFAGGCEPEKVKSMVAELQAEAPGAEKKMYTPPLVAVGEVIPDFTIPAAEGGDVSLNFLCKDGGALLLFSATTCGFSVSALDDLEKLKQDFKEKKFGYVVVGFGQDKQAIGDVYSLKSPESTVVIDADKSLSQKYFSVSAVPFFYVLDQNRKVVARSPFTLEAAKGAVSKALGLSAGCGEGGAAAKGGG